jgi:hypothetical protein
MRRADTEICGVKAGDGAPCVLEPGHDPQEWWETRKHQTEGGTVFTWKQPLRFDPIPPPVVW